MVAEWTTYTDPGGYSIEVPADWEIDRYVVPADERVVGAATSTSFDASWGWVNIYHSRAGTGYYTWDSFGSFVAEEVAELEADPEVEQVALTELDESHYRVDFVRKPPEYCVEFVARRYIYQGPYYGGEWAKVTVLVCAWQYDAAFVERIINSFAF